MAPCYGPASRRHFQFVGEARLRDDPVLPLTERSTIMNANHDPVDQAELDRHGIETVPANAYLWGGYRYSHARDAIAAAKRGAKA